MTFPTEQQVEAVARARYERAQCNGEPPWEQLSAQCREDLRDAVRAILTDFFSAAPEWREMERSGGLTFSALRAANRARLPQFRTKHGDLAHSKPDGSDWSPAQWLQAVVGELGEYANVRKKFERGDLTQEEFYAMASDELADVQTYLDILAFQLGIDLGAATADKFNRVSKRVGSDVFIDAAREREG